jgi:phage shock protein E
MKKYILFIVGAIWVFSATPVLSQDTSGSALSYKKFEKKIKKKNAVVLDVRTANEYKSGYIPHALNYNVLDSLSFEKAVQPLDKNKKYFLYCKSGKRSGKALIMMKQMGFTKVQHLAGGITEWKGETVKPL